MTKLTTNEVKTLERAARILEKLVLTSDTFSSPEMAGRYLQAKIGAKPHEAFVALFMSTKHQVIAVDEMFRGTIDGAAVYPREVVKAALDHNAAAIIFAHNHPSGSLEFSEADRAITRRLQDALSYVDVRVLDHILVSPAGWVSMAQRGWL